MLRKEIKNFANTERNKEARFKQDRHFFFIFTRAVQI